MIKILLFFSFSLFCLFDSKKNQFSLCYIYLMITYLLFFGLFSGSGLKMFSRIIGADSLSISLLILRSWVSLLIVLRRSIIYYKNNSVNLFLFLVSLLLIRLLLSFLSLNLIIFYFFFEFSLIPTLLLIMGWGYQPERIQAGIYFLFYTLTASLPLLLGLLFIYNKFNRLVFLFLDPIYLSKSLGYFFIFCIRIAFLVKIPLFIFHLWLPKAHVEAPVAGSIILAGVLLKLGGFGLCRIINLVSLNLFKLNSYIVGICLMGMVYVGLICCRLNDLKALVAYSSVAHIGLVICGIYSYYVWGFTGCLAIIISHGISSSGLFCIVNIYYERSHSRSIYLNKGLILISSIFCLIFFFLCAANISAPPSINLISEIFLMARVMGLDMMIIMVFPLGSFLGTVFTIYIFSYSQHGKNFFGIIRGFNSMFYEYIILLLHIIPLNIVIVVSEFFFIG